MDSAPVLPFPMGLFMAVSSNHYYTKITCAVPAHSATGYVVPELLAPLVTLVLFII